MLFPGMNKKATGRNQDLADLKNLEELSFFISLTYQKATVIIVVAPPTS
jgi:hypothetical protein